MGYATATDPYILEVDAKSNATVSAKQWTFQFANVLPDSFGIIRTFGKEVALPASVLDLTGSWILLESVDVHPCIPVKTAKLFATVKALLMKLRRVATADFLSRGLIVRLPVLEWEF